MKKRFALLLAACVVLSMVGCNNETPAGTVADPNTGVAPPTGQTFVDNYPKYAAMEDHYARSSAVYEQVLGEFYRCYTVAKEAETLSQRYALMAIAEAKLLASGVFLPTIAQGGNYAMTRVAPYTSSPVLWGNDQDRFHDNIVTTQPIEAAHIAEMKETWARLLGSGDYEAWVKSYLKEKGYQLTDHLNHYYEADPESWDVLATASAADTEILVNTYEGLVEYDMEKTLQPALAESWTVSDDGLRYTFRIRKNVKWVDNQGRPVAEVKADDFVAGMQHMMDTMGGLEYLVQGVIVNADEYINAEITDFSQVGVKAIDDYTVEYTLCQPTSYFMTMLGYGVFAPLSRGYYRSRGGKFGEDFDPTDPSYTYGKGPDSIAYCGPFRITGFTSNNTVVFASNEAYWNAGGNNLSSMTFLYTDGSDPRKPYDDFFGGVVDTLAMTAERIALAKEKGTYERYAYVSDTNAVTYCGYFNVNRSAYANFNNAQVGKSPKTQRQQTRTGSAMLNRHFRLALAMSVDRGAYNAQSVGEELKDNALTNSYTPGNFVFLEEAVTVELNGQPKTYAAGTQYGQILQDQLDADGVALTVWNGTASTGFDGWYDPGAARAELEQAVAELGAWGIGISAEDPIYIDLPYRSDSVSNTNQKQAMKQSIEASTGGLVRVNLIAYTNRDAYLDATYWHSSGNEANFDLNDGSGWGPDYGDPSSYLDTMLPDGAGYKTKSLGLF